MPPTQYAAIHHRDNEHHHHHHHSLHPAATEFLYTCVPTSGSSYTLQINRSRSASEIVVRIKKKINNCE